MKRRIIVIIDWCNNENCFQDSRIHWSGNEDPEGEFPALSDRTEGAETQSGRSDIRQPHQEKMQTVTLWKLEGEYTDEHRKYWNIVSMVKVMFEEGDQPGIIFQHSQTGSKVRSLWITGTSGDLQGWKGNCSNLSIILLLLLFTQSESCQVTVSGERLDKFQLEIVTEDRRMKIMCYDLTIEWGVLS